jgi:hypothetical protein
LFPDAAPTLATPCGIVETVVRLILLLTAVAVAVLPVPARLVEAHYSEGLYPVLQRALTRTSNLVPIALLDVAGGLLVLLAVVALVRKYRTSGAARATRWAAGSALAAAAVVYLLFVALWGLNYRRVPLERKLEYDAVRVNHEGVGRLARTALAEVNALAEVDRDGTPLDALAQAFADAHLRLGAARPAVVGRPKTSVLVPYFRHAAIDGMTDPFFLEIIVNTDVLPFERPFVVAHEWAHLAGYADESEANFVAWVTCVGASDAGARYSGWLAAYQHAVAVLPREERRALNADLHPHAAADLRAIAERLGKATPAIRQAARNAYDTYLRANRVEEGIESYGAVLRLMLGTSFDNGWAPRLRSAP